MAEQQQVQCPHCGQPYTVPPEQIPQYLGQTIICQNCRQPFVVSGTAEKLETAAAPAPPPPPAPPQPGQPLSYATPYGPQRTDGMSIAALITGILALFIPIVAGIVAIVLGAIGLKRTADPQVGGRGFAIAGLTLGIVGIVMSTCMISILLPSLNRARETANRVKCASNMRQIGLAIIMYHDENRGYYPPNLEAVLLTQDITPAVFICPSSNDYPATATILEQQGLTAGPHLSYVYVRPAERERDVADPGNTVILYEPMTNHRDGGNFLYADGHVEFHAGPSAQQIIQQLQPWSEP